MILLYNLILFLMGKQFPTTDGFFFFNHMTHSIIDFFLSVLPTFVGLTGSLLVFIVHQNSPRASLYTEYIQERKREKKILQFPSCVEGSGYYNTSYQGRKEGNK